MEMRICFDLDNTLCFGASYEEAQPHHWAAELLDLLKRGGHEIIIYTARKMTTCNGNIGKVNKSIGLLTFNQLEEWGFVYDEIYFGKPAADIYIDDKGLNYINYEQLLNYLTGELKCLQ